MLIVQKFGGTSVGNTDRIKNVAARVAKYRNQGDQIVLSVHERLQLKENMVEELAGVEQRVETGHPRLDRRVEPMKA